MIILSQIVSIALAIDLYHTTRIVELLWVTQNPDPKGP